MLKKISPLLSANLLKVLYEMGHGDEIAIVDANYPAASCKASHYITADGINSVHLLKAILELLPVDTYVKKPFKIMQVVEGDPVKPIIWDDYKRVIAKYGFDDSHIEYMERFEYYKHCNTVYCVLASGERALYGNIVIKKGVLPI